MNCVTKAGRAAMGPFLSTSSLVRPLTGWCALTHQGGRCSEGSSRTDVHRLGGGTHTVHGLEGGTHSAWAGRGHTHSASAGRGHTHSPPRAMSLHCVNPPTAFQPLICSSSSAAHHLQPIICSPSSSARHLQPIIRHLEPPLRQPPHCVIFSGCLWNEHAQSGGGGSCGSCPMEQAHASLTIPGGGGGGAGVEHARWTERMAHAPLTIPLGPCPFDHAPVSMPRAHHGRRVLARAAPLPAPSAVRQRDPSRCHRQCDSEAVPV